MRDGGWVHELDAFVVVWSVVEVLEEPLAAAEQDGHDHEAQLVEPGADENDASNVQSPINASRRSIAALRAAWSISMSPPGEPAIEGSVNQDRPVTRKSSLKLDSFTTTDSRDRPSLHVRRAMVMISGLLAVNGLSSQSPNCCSIAKPAPDRSEAIRLVSRKRKVLWLASGRSQLGLVNV